LKVLLVQRSFCEFIRICEAGPLPPATPLADSTARAW
jgi:hypothetical protein